jgi:alanine dehydrogenase
LREFPAVEAHSLHLIKQPDRINQNQEFVVKVNHSILEHSGLSCQTLGGKTAIVTGAGGGIGYQAARALLWLGANVVIAEINLQSGEQAERKLAAEFGEIESLSSTPMWVTKARWSA